MEQECCLGGTLRSALPWCHQRPALAHPSSSPGAGVGFVLTPHLHTLHHLLGLFTHYNTEKIRGGSL